MEEHQDTLTLISHRGLDFMVWQNPEGKNVAHDKNIVGHGFQSGEIKIHRRSCRSVKMERRGTGHAQKMGHGQVDMVYHGLTIREIAEAHFTDMIDQSMTVEEAVGYMGKSVCNCVHKWMKEQSMTCKPVSND